MENLEEDSNVEEMASEHVDSERSRLFTQPPPNEPKTSFVNLFNNICALTLISQLFYHCFFGDYSLFSFHPTCMSIGWLLVMSSAISALTPGDFATEWMPIRLRSARHWVLQVCGLFFLSIGFIIILINKHIHGKDHFTSYHGRFGLTSMIFVGMTSTGGLLALNSLKLKKFVAPVYVKILHTVFGLVTFTLGCVTISLGLFSQWWAFGEFARYLSLVLVIIIMILTIARPSIKTYARIREKLSHIIRE